MAKHEIKQGDTLWAISRKATGRGINYKLIAELNDIEDPNNVPIGTELYIPDKNTNRVSTKDLEEGNGFIEMDEYSPDYDYAVKGNSVYYRMKGTDVWSDISDAPGIKDRFRNYIAEEVSQKEPAQPAPAVPDSATLGNAAPYVNTNPAQPASTQEPSDEDSLFDQIMYYGNLAVNGLRRAFLKRFGDDDQTSLLNVPDEPEINPLDVSFTGDTVHVDDRRYFLPESLNINNARFGYRNRGDFSEREGIGAITAFNPFRPKSQINSKKGFYIGVSGDGKFKYGDISKFDDTDMISRVYVNRVKSFDTNDDGSLRFKEAGKGNQGRYMPVINVIEGGKEVKGSLNFLTGKDHRTDTYGDITGGRVLLITDDGRIRLVSGSIDDVRKEFERVKELSGQDALNVVVLDNGTYSRGLRTYDNRMTEGDLRSYDAQNTSGGNFLFIQDLMETNNVAQRRGGGPVSPLVVQTFNPDAFAEAMKSMERVGDGSGRKVDTKNMEKIYYGLVSRGVNGNQLKALMGAIAEESGGDPYVESSGKNYRGLSQWSKERLTDEEFKKIKEMSVDDAIDYELDKLIDGLNATSGSDSFTHGGKGSGYDTGAQAMNAFWNQDGTLESVVHALNNGYIRPGDREGTTENRIRAARLLNNEGVLTNNNAPEEFRPIIEDPFFGYYKADGGPTSDEYREMFRDLYKQDIERIQNGERAVFFGHLNDEPLENVYPEFDLIFNPTKVISPKGNYGNVVGFSSEDAWKALDKATDIQELIIRVPYNLGRMLNEFVSDVSTKGAKKLINMAPEKYRDTLTKIGRYVKKRPKLTTSFLTSFFYNDITGRNKEAQQPKEQQAQESFDDAFRRAIESGEERFTWNGKEYTTETRPDGGPVNKGGYIAASDAIQPPANPTIDFMNLIGESIPYDAGTLPDINVIMDLSPEEYRDAMRKAAARRGRNYVYQSQEEAAPLIQGLAGAAAAASLASVGLFQPTMNFAADFMGMLENPLDPVNYLPYSDVFKIAKKTNSYDEIERMVENRRNVKDEYSESVRKFFKNILVPEYERIIERNRNNLSENGRKLLESRMNGSNQLDFIEDANRLGISDEEFGDIQKTAVMQLNADLIKKEIDKPDAFNYNIGWTKNGSMGEYNQYDDNVYLSKTAELAGFDTKFSTLIHEFRHKMDSKGISRKTANDVLRRFSLSENEIKTLEDAYNPTGITEKSDDLSEIISTNTELKTRIIQSVSKNKKIERLPEPDEILGVYDIQEDRFKEILDNTSDDDLLDMLESTNDYGADYASNIRNMKEKESKERAIKAIRKAVSTIPFSVVSINQAIHLMDDKPVREEDIVQGGNQMDIETANNIVYNNLRGEMRDGGSFSNYLSKVDGDNLINKLSKTNYYGKKRANLFKLARMGNKEAYNVLIDDFKEKLLEIDRKQNKNNYYEEGDEIDEDLSPNEAILRRIANDLSSRNMLAENAAYYSGQDEITAEELANYIGKMSPHRFVMSIGSDDEELNDFGTRLTTGVLDGDEQAMEDAETLRRMMLETPFNNSNITIMRDGGNMLPGLEDMYMTPELLEYEQGGEAVKDRQMYVYKRLKEEAHMDDLQALAVIGNLMGESGLNPYLYGDQDTSYGIQQWRGERRDRLNKLAREKGEEIPSFETQVDYLISEYLAKPGKNGFIYDDKGKMGSGYYNYSRKDFQNASTLRDATVAWNLGSGRPHKNYMRNDERYEFAKQAAKNLGIELNEPDENYYSDNGVVQNGFRAPSINLAQNSTPKESDNSRSSTVKIEEGNIPDRSGSKPSNDMTDFQRSVINELLIQRGLIMGEQVRQQEEAKAQMIAEEKQARINEEARRNAIIQSVLQNAKLDIPGMASR